MAIGPFITRGGGARRSFANPFADRPDRVTVNAAIVPWSVDGQGQVVLDAAPADGAEIIFYPKDTELAAFDAQQNRVFANTDYPEHRWNGNSLQFRQNTGFWGEERDLGNAEASAEALAAAAEARAATAAALGAAAGQAVDALAPILSQQYDYTGQFQVATADGDGNILVGREPVSNQPIGKSAVIPRKKRLIVILYGQSLKYGAQATVLTATAPRPNIKTFGSGLRSGRPGSIWSLLDAQTPGTSTEIAAFENESGMWSTPGSLIGETGGVQLCVDLIDRASRYLGEDPNKHTYFVHCASRGNQTVAALGLAPQFAVLKEQMEDAKDRADAAGEDAEVIALDYAQGPADAILSTPTDRAAFAAATQLISDNVNMLAAAIFRQSRPVHMFVSQSPHALATTTNIAYGTLDAVDASPLIHFVGPEWDSAYYPDRIHKEARGYWIMCKRSARAIFQKVYLGKDPHALRLLSVLINPHTQRVEYRWSGAETYPIVVDQSAAMGGIIAQLGCRLVDGAGDVVLTDPQALADGMGVSFAMSRLTSGVTTGRVGSDYAGTTIPSFPIGSAGCNIRDSTAETARTPDGTIWPLYHIAPAEAKTAQVLT